MLAFSHDYVFVCLRFFMFRFSYDYVFMVTFCCVNIFLWLWSSLYMYLCVCDYRHIYSFHVYSFIYSIYVHASIPTCISRCSYIWDCQGLLNTFPVDVNARIPFMHQEVWCNKKRVYLFEIITKGGACFEYQLHNYILEF